LAILPIYTYEQPVLRRKARPVQGTSEPLVRFIQDMFQTMHNASGIGLAANQVGSLQRVIVVDISEVDEEKYPAESPAAKKPLVLINPEIVAAEGSLVLEEGCLSIPDIRDDVDRPDRIRVRFRNMEFAEQELNADGLLARVIQHEIDHLNGVLFIDRVGTARRKLLTGRLNKVRKGEFEVGYPVVSAVPVGAETK
jgi:peptide deformylase